MSEDGCTGRPASLKAWLDGATTDYFTSTVLCELNRFPAPPFYENLGRLKAA